MNMNEKFKEVFGQIQADEGLKNRTKAFLDQKTQGYTRAKTGKRRLFPVAACMSVLLMVFGGNWIYFTPVAAISIDINPSIELNINRFDQVVGVTELNEDGQALSDTLDVKYKAYTDAIEAVLQNDLVAALLSDDEVMTITVTGSNAQQSVEILSQVEGSTAAQENVDCYVASPEEAAAAHEAGLSCGKYRAFLELQQLDPTVTPEMVQGMTMKEIRTWIASLSPDGDQTSTSGNGQGNGNGHGNGHGNGQGNGHGNGHGGGNHHGAWE